MTQKICPRCRRVFTFQPGTIDYEYQCNSLNPTLDNEDIVDIDNNGWNRLGIENEADTIARLEGANIDEINSRGVRSRTHRSRQHFKFVKL